MSVWLVYFCVTNRSPIFKKKATDVAVLVIFYRFEIIERTNDQNFQVNKIEASYRPPRVLRLIETCVSTCARPRRLCAPSARICFNRFISPLSWRLVCISFATQDSSS